MERPGTEAIITKIQLSKPKCAEQLVKPNLFSPDFIILSQTVAEKTLMKMSMRYT